MKTLIVIPAFNEARVIDDVLKRLCEECKFDIVVIDDGSIDNTKALAKKQVRVVRHFMNRGLGAALMTGIEIARREGYDRMATYDGDGQHHPMDLLGVLECLNHSVDVVIGSRFMDKSIEEMPLVKKVGNSFLNITTRVFYGVKCSDSQSGLRAFNRKAIETINVEVDRYEVSTRILASAKEHGLRIKEVPIKTIYTEHSKRRGTDAMEGIKIFMRLLYDVFYRI